jgi:hypothetical protein
MSLGQDNAGKLDGPEAAPGRPAYSRTLGLLVKGQETTRFGTFHPGSLVSA